VKNKLSSDVKPVYNILG